MSSQSIRRRLIKKIFLTIICILLITLTPVLYIVITFGDDDYKKSLIWAVEHFTDYELIVDGDFSLDPSLEPILVASRLVMKSSNGDQEIRIGQVDIQIALMPLFSDILNIKHLNITDVDIDRFEIEQSVAGSYTTIPWGLLPVLELANFRNIRYRDERTAKLSAIDISLEKLQLKEAYPDGSRILEGAGRIGTDEFVLNGEMGSLAELFEPTQAFPFKFNWELPGGMIRVKGTIDDPWTGQGANLVLSSDLHDLDYLLSRFYSDVPDLGHLNISGTLTGDYPALTLGSLKLSLLRDETVTINASGHIGDITNLTGMDIEYEIALNDPAMINRYLPERAPHIQQLITNGRLHSNENEAPVLQAKLKMTNDQGLLIHAQGYTDVLDALAQLPVDNTQVAVSITSPTIDALAPFLIKKIPESGAVTGQIHLIASNGKLAVDELNIAVGTDNSLKVGIEGEIGMINFDREDPINDVSLDVAVDSDNIAPIMDLLGFELPGSGSIRARMHLDIKDKIAVVDIGDFYAQHDGQLSVKADGSIVFRDILADKIINECDLDVQIAAQSSAFISDHTEYAMPDIGAIDAQFKLQGNNDQLTLKNIKLIAGNEDTIKILLTGRIDEFQSVNKFGNTDIQGNMHINNFDGLSLTTKKLLSTFGPVNSNFSITGNSTGLTIPKLSLFVEDDKDIRIAGEGKIEKIQLFPTPEVSGINIPVELFTRSTEQFNTLVDENLPELGPLYSKAVLIDHKGNPRLENIVLQIGEKQQPIIQASGQLDYSLNNNNIYLDSLFETDISLFLSRISGQKAPDLGKITGRMKLDDSDGTLGFEILQVSGSKVGIYSLNANGSYDDIKQHRELMFDMQLHAEDMDHFDGLFGQDYPITGPIDLKGHVSDDGERVYFDGDIHFLEGIFSVDLDGLFTGGRPKITGKILTPELTVKKIMTFYQQEPEAATNIKDETNHRSNTTTNPYEQRKQIADIQKSEAAPLFGKQAINFDPLNWLDLDLQIVIDEVTGAGVHIDNIETRIKLDNGELRIHPASVYFEHGFVKLDATVNTANSTQVSVNLKAEDVNLEKLTSRFQENKTIDGDLHLNIDLTSTGNSLHELVSNLNGKSGWAIENGKIYTNALDMLHLNILTWFLGGVLTNQERDIICAISHYTITDGLMESDIFYFGTTTDEFFAKGTINLATEELDLVLQARQKKLLRRSKKNYDIVGTIRQPKVKGVPFIQSLATYGSAIFAPVLFLPGAAVGDLWSLVNEGHGGACAETREQAEKKTDRTGGAKQ